MAHECPSTLEHLLGIICWNNGRDDRCKIFLILNNVSVINIVFIWVLLQGAIWLTPILQLIYLLHVLKFMVKYVSCNTRKCSIWHVHAMNSNQHALLHSLIRVFVVHLKKLVYPKCVHWRFLSDCANMQADLNLCWAHIQSYISDIMAHILHIAESLNIQLSINILALAKRGIPIINFFENIYLGEAIPMSTNNICLDREIRKITMLLDWKMCLI